MFQDRVLAKNLHQCYTEYIKLNYSTHNLPSEQSKFLHFHIMCGITVGTTGKKNAMKELSPSLF